MLAILQNDSDSGEELNIDESHDRLYCEEEVDQENELEELAIPLSQARTCSRQRVTEMCLSQVRSLK